MIKYIQLCSGTRNRLQWPNPFSFAIVNINTQPAYFNDPICSSAPVLDFIPLPSKTKLALDVLHNGWNFCTGQFDQRLNAYRGAYVVGTKILESRTMGNLLMFKVSTGLPYPADFIETYTNPAAGLLHLPGMSALEGMYKGWMLVNETLGAHTQVVDYLESVACFKPQPLWKVEHRYTLRKMYNVLKRTMTASGDGVLVSAPVPYTSPDCFVRQMSTGSLLRVLGVSDDRTRLSVYPQIGSAVNEPCEILPITGDNVQSFNFTDQGMAYMMELTHLVLPNIPLQNGVNVASLGFVYVDVMINRFTSKSGSYSSNNPAASKAGFALCLAGASLKSNGRLLEIAILNGPSIETTMADLTELSVTLRDDNGVLVPLEADWMAPIGHNPEMQVTLSLKLTST